MRRLFSFLCISLCSCISSYAEHTSVLFILYDAGETYGLLPIMEQLSDYRVMVMGTARDLVPPSDKVIDINDVMNVYPRIDRSFWKRKDAVPIEQLSKIQITADIVITGVASVVQQQLSAHFKSQGSTILTFYDNMTYTLPNHPYRDVIAPFQKLTNLMLVPSATIGKSLSCKYEVVGQPTLEAWTKTLSSIDSYDMRHSLGFGNAPLMVYCGGYGEDYANALQLFGECIQDLDGWQVITQLHPKVDGDLEAAVLNVPVYKDTPGTVALVAAADVVVCHRSSAGVLALLSGKEVIFVDVPGSTFTHFGIECGASPLATTVDEFHRALMKKSPYSISELHKLAGMPQDPTNRILKVIHRVLLSTPQEYRSVLL